MGKIFDAVEKAKEEKNAFFLIHDEINHGAKIKGPSIDNVRKLSQNGRIDKNLITFFEPMSPEADQFRKIGTNILFGRAKDAPLRILVTSADEGEGKSFVAANLSISIAQNLDEKVLLVDCDLRAPSIHKKFGIVDGFGLNEHFSQEISVSNLIHETIVNGLSILTSGKTSSKSKKLLSSKRMAELIQELSQNNAYKFIIIDAPPPLLAAEAMAIAKQVDGILLVVNCGKTPREMVTDLIKNIGNEKIIGVVLNRFNKRFSTYKKYGKYLA